ncbi:MAG TPA: hypothetical protein VMV10_13570 [Pirellulales bacterium]|nr:hypothetical protein [Pirellulales bacterium]
MRSVFTRGCLQAAVLCCALVAGLLGSGRSALAEEAYEKFIGGLKDQGLYDIALEYVRSMKDSPLITQEQREEIPLKEGELLVDSAQAERDTATKFKQLDQARERFESFIKANSSHPKAADAELQLGAVLVVRGNSLVEQANRPANAAKKDQLLSDARELMSQGQKVFNAAEEKFIAEEKSYDRFIDQKKDPKKFEARRIARARVLEASLRSGDVIFSLAKTYPQGSEDARKLLQKAADKFAEVYSKHRQVLAGLLARIKEGECYQNMGETKRALGLYETILGQPDDDALRKMKSAAMHLAMQCMVTDAEKKYDIAIAKGQEWLGKARPDEERSPDGLGIRYHLALADKKLADSLEKPDEKGRKSALVADARKQASYVRKMPGAYKVDADKLYASLGAGDDSAQKEPTNFVEARDRGREMLERWQEREQAIKNAPVMKDQANVPKYQQESAEFRAKALEYFHRAMELRDDETSIDDVNIVRYYLCFLAYNSGQFYDAAVMGEFLAKNYPQSSGGRQCAKIALSAYQQGYLDKRAIQPEFDKQKMVEIAEYITLRWAGQEEADEAWTTLMEIAIYDNETDKAIEYLDKIAPDSPRRGNAELKAGQALWAAYLTAGRAAAAQRRPQAELDAMVAKAKATLEDGIKRMRVGVDNGAAVVSPTLAAATLSLGQILVDSGQAEKAIELLNDPKIGPLTLVAAKDPAVAQGKFGIEAYKLALRAYVATQALDKAEQAMNDLEKLAAAQGGDDVAGTLTRIYVGLGRELQAQVTRLRQENKDEELAKVSKGFELFLERILERKTGNDFRSLNWVADTFYNLGSGYDAGGAKQLSPEAKAYYEKSLKADQQILAEAKNNKGFLEEPNLEFGVKLRMARSERRLGQYNDSIKQLTEILKQKPTLVEVQREAAETLQDWSTIKPTYYKLAILGAVKQKGAGGRQENLIWGWATLAVRVQSNKEFDADFYEARYNLAKCHMEQAKLEKDPAKKKALLRQAERDITYTARLWPEMGGPEARKKASSLLETIQKLLGVKPTGLPAPKAIAAPKPAAPKVQPAVSSQPSGSPAAASGVKPFVKPTVSVGSQDASNK